MTEYQSADIRNIAVVGHGASGKTMLCESMLACAGVVNRLGSIANGSTVSDYHDDEQERQISIHATLLNAEWLGKKFNIIDTPGYTDFIGEALSALSAVDAALIVIHANQGVEVGTEQVWNYASKFNLPKMLVVSALDKEHTDYDSILTKARERFGHNVFPMQIPVNPGPAFNQVLDVQRKKILTFQNDGSGKFEESDPQGNWAGKADEMHEALIEYVAESDDSLLEKFFEEGGLSEEEMRAGIHAALQNNAFVPMFCVAGGSNIGVARLLDYIAKYGASPEDRPVIKAIDAKTDKEIEIKLTDSELVMRIFKTVSEAHVGEMSFFRTYSGTLKTGADLLNVNQNNPERFGQFFVMNAKNRTTASILHAGDIGAVVKLKNTHTGDTICDHKRKVIIKPVQYPKPNIHSAIRAKAKGDEEKIAVGLATLHEEDPTFVYRVDPEVKQTIISGQGELHLTVIVNRLQSRFNVEIVIMEPKIPYRETIKGKGESKYRHKKQSGGAGQFAEVWMRVEPKARGEGIEFTDSLVGQNVDRVFVTSVEKGVNVALQSGVIAGCTVVDLKINFYDGKMHPVDSKDIAFQIAGKQAFRECFRNAKPCLLEPIMIVDVKVPEEFMGDVMGDISGRRGKILGMESDGGFQIIIAQVRQAEWYPSSTTIRSLTGGRGLHSEECSHYEDMPKDR
ncbi:MAG: elongation factor G, partial [Candidatus Neomarinimicrobiota bacterium]